jgi:putative flippase GtrA
MGSSGQEGLKRHPHLGRQIPSFVLIGTLGFFIDAGLTFVFAQWFGAPALLARPPAFAIATLVNFALNRTFTFRAAELSVLPALAKYVLVCAGGAGVNYAVYAICLNVAPFVGLDVTPKILPLFVACGSLSAMSLTFMGFRSFAFVTPKPLI